MILQSYDKLRRCLLFSRMPRVAYRRNVVRSISLAIITFSAIKYGHLFMAAMLPSCIVANFNHIVCVILVVVANINADLTGYHNWPTKTTNIKKKASRTQSKHYIRSSKLISAIM